MPISVLAALAQPVRLRLLLAVLNGRHTSADTVALTVAVGFLCGWNGHSVTTGIAVAAATGGAALAAVVGDNGRGCRSPLRPGRRHR